MSVLSSEWAWLSSASNREWKYEFNCGNSLLFSHIKEVQRSAAQG